MTDFEPFSARPLDPHDLAAARELASRSGAHGMYVGNHLAQMAAGRDDDGGEVLACYGAAGVVALAWFGARGNLIVLQAGGLDPAALARAIDRSGWSWRIVLGPPAVVEALGARLRVPPLVNREQVYYGIEPDAVPVELLCDDVRVPGRSDQRMLVRAAVDLNFEDLGIDPARVDRSWVKRAVRDRIRQGTTRVLGPEGAPRCKLDFGSEGLAGRMLEGVYTFPPSRGQGLATRLVATAVAESRDRYPLVCLHVGASNDFARRAYVRAGMRRMGSCQLLLKS